MPPMGLFTIGPIQEEKPNYEKDLKIYEILQRYQASSAENNNNGCFCNSHNKTSKSTNGNNNFGSRYFGEEEYVFNKANQTWELPSMIKQQQNAK